jgi:hypothetical protein
VRGIDHSGAHASSLPHSGAPSHTRACGMPPVRAPTHRHLIICCSISNRTGFGTSRKVSFGAFTSEPCTTRTPFPQRANCFNSMGSSCCDRGPVDQSIGGRLWGATCWPGTGPRIQSWFSKSAPDATKLGGSGGEPYPDREETRSCCACPQRFLHLTWRSITPVVPSRIDSPVASAGHNQKGAARRTITLPKRIKIVRAHFWCRQYWPVTVLPSAAATDALEFFIQQLIFLVDVVISVAVCVRAIC